MSDFLIDHTRDHLMAAAECAAFAETGDLRIRITATREGVLVGACLGGVHKTWINDICSWRKVANQEDNPLLPMIEGVIFRAKRQAALVAGGESPQECAP